MHLDLFATAEEAALGQGVLAGLVHVCRHCALGVALEARARRGDEGARRVHGAGAWQDRAESLVLHGRIIIAVHRAFVSGCEGSSIAVLCSVASRRVARET